MIHFCVFCTEVFSTSEERDSHMSTHLPAQMNHTVSSPNESSFNRTIKRPEKFKKEKYQPTPQPSANMTPQMGGERYMRTVSSNDASIRKTHDEDDSHISGIQSSLPVTSSSSPILQKSANLPMQSSPLPYTQNATEQSIPLVKITHDIGLQNTISYIQEYSCSECGFQFDNVPQGEHSI